MIKRTTEWLYDRAFPIFTVSILLAIIGGTVYLMHRDSVWWAAYKVTQNCHPSDKTRTQVVIQWIHGPQGNITGSFPLFITERLWKCDTISVWRAE